MDHPNHAGQPAVAFASAALAGDAGRQPLLVTEKDYNHLLRSLTSLGRMLADCGAEIYRVEETVSRVASAYTGEEVEVFAVLTYMSVSITSHDGLIYNRSVRLRGASADLDRLEKLNSLARSLCACPLPLPTFENELNILRSSPTNSFLLKTAGGAVGGMAFACMLGCRPLVALWGILITILMYLALRPLTRLGTNPVFINLLGSALITALSVLLERIFGIPTEESGKITIGCLMNLVPGLTLTNGIRDLIASDFVAGVSHLTQALLMAFGLAAGSGAVIAIASLL